MARHSFLRLHGPFFLYLIVAVMNILGRNAHSRML